MLKDTIKQDRITAMKAGDATARTTISMLMAAIKNRELEKRGKLAKEGTAESELDTASALTEEEIVSVVSSELKKRKESITTYEDAGRTELSDAEKAEMKVLEKYLPEQMDEEEISHLITDAIAQTGAAGPGDMGKVMGVVSGKTKGRFDGKRLSEMVKEALSA